MPKKEWNVGLKLYICLGIYSPRNGTTEARQEHAYSRKLMSTKVYQISTSILYMEALVST